MWKKSIAISLLLCLSCCSLQPAFSQSATPATWDNFDQTLQALKTEIESLNGELLKAQSSLQASKVELNQLKGQLITQSIRLDEYASSLKRSKESLLTSEAARNKAEGWLFFSLLANAAFIGGTVYFALH